MVLLATSSEVSWLACHRNAVELLLSPRPDRVTGKVQVRPGLQVQKHTTDIASVCK